jgi:hypothetical protein
MDLMKCYKLVECSPEEIMAITQNAPNVCTPHVITSSCHGAVERTAMAEHRSNQTELSYTETSCRGTVMAFNLYWLNPSKV